jgi:hypothetical protein
MYTGFHTAHKEIPKGFLENPESFIKGFLENPWEGFSTQTLFRFPENLYGFFTPCEKRLWVSRKSLGARYMCW